MATIVTRIGKGSALTWVEGDANFTNLNTDKAELSGAAFTGAITSTSPISTESYFRTGTTGGLGQVLFNRGSDGFTFWTLKVTDATATPGFGVYNSGTATYAVSFDGTTNAATFTAAVSATNLTASSAVQGASVRVTGATASRAAYFDANKDIQPANTTTTELNYVNGVTSAIQAQIDNIVGRNRIINGAMRIDQRNAGAAVSVASAAATFGVDRWFGYGQGADGVFSMQQLTTTPPTGYTNYLRYKTTTADASIGAAQLYFGGQNIEGNNTADLDFGLSTAKTITLSFWVRSSLTGTFGGSVSNATNRCYVFSYVINAANTWEQKTVTITGDVTGTWATNSSTGLALFFDLGCGTNNKGTAGSWGSTFYYGVTSGTNLISTVNATWDITGVQLEAGSVASAFERRSFGIEAALCERYYQKSYGLTVVPATVTTAGAVQFFDSSTGGYYTNTFRTRMRGTPSCNTYSPATGTGSAYRDGSSAADFGATYANEGESSFVISLASHGAVNETVSWHWTATAEL